MAQAVCKFSVVIAATVADFGIGHRGTIPWRIPTDVKFFRDVTTTTSPNNRPAGLVRNFQNCTIMGRKSYFSIPTKFRPLPNRLNIIISRNENLRREEQLPDNVLVSPSLSAALQLATSLQYATDVQIAKVEATVRAEGTAGPGCELPCVDSVAMIGGASIYEEAMLMPSCEWFFLTLVHSPNYECDVKLPIVSDLVDITEQKDSVFKVRARSPLLEQNLNKFEFLALSRSETTPPFPLPDIVYEPQSNGM